MAEPTERRSSRRPEDTVSESNGPPTERVAPSIKRHHRHSGRSVRATLLTHLEAGERYSETVRNEALGRDVTIVRVATTCGLDAPITVTSKSVAGSDCAECISAVHRLPDDGYQPLSADPDDGIDAPLATPEDAT